MSPMLAEEESKQGFQCGLLGEAVSLARRGDQYGLDGVRLRVVCVSDKIQAVIGVWLRGPRTFYVLRSPQMTNYPGVWSLPSIQFTAEELPEPTDVRAAKAVLQRMSDERFERALVVGDIQLLTSGWCDSNPTGKLVELYLYSFELPAIPALQPRYYTDSAFLLPEEYVARSAGARCGLCTRLWSEESYRTGLVAERFAPEPEHVW